MSRDNSRATTNDKRFGEKFPYLPPPWTKDESDDHAFAGTSVAYQGDDGNQKQFPVPFPPDMDATRLPDFSSAVWRSVWWGLLIGIIITGALAFWALRAVLARALIVLVARRPVFDQPDYRRRAR